MEYDWELWRGLHLPNAKPPAPDWLVNLLGIDYFGNVVRVYFSNAYWHSRPTQLSDELLRGLGEMKQLERLGLDNSSFDDQGLAYIRNLRQLKELYLGRTEVSDAGLGDIRGMTELRWLRLEHTRVTDAGVQELWACLPNLEHLEYKYSRNQKGGHAEY